MTTLSRPSRAALLGWPLGAVAGAALVGGLVGGAVAFLVVAAGGRDGWNDLVAAAIGTLTAGAVAVITWALLLVLGARRLFPARRRAVPVLLTLGSGAVAVVGAVWLAVAAGEAAVPDGALLLPVPVAVLSIAVFPWWQRRLDHAAAPAPR